MHRLCRLDMAVLMVRLCVGALRTPRAFVPALFCAGQQDDFISPNHSQQIHDRYAGDKNIVLVPGGHNSDRPAFFQASAAIFLRETMHLPPHFSVDTATARSPAARRGSTIDDFGDSALASVFAGGDAPDQTRQNSALNREGEMIRQAMAVTQLMAGGGRQSAQAGVRGGGSAGSPPAPAGAERVNADCAAATVTDLGIDLENLGMTAEEVVAARRMAEEFERSSTCVGRAKDADQTPPTASRPALRIDVSPTATVVSAAAPSATPVDAPSPPFARQVPILPPLSPPGRNGTAHNPWVTPRRGSVDESDQL